MKQYNWEQDQIAHMKVNFNIEYIILVTQIVYLTIIINLLLSS